ncbi:hypothetical protein EKO04_007282 [Ascochyta lentis]|uniref:Enoyl reductase (ER) domain-containing protein n=1 Tax=Ascochyta lentis TaxID=205686 RepID=A0A8H7J189_9PLEO|nr:hypothetical protein EKO04_007282 [Ascochyta lentis]
MSTHDAVATVGIRAKLGLIQVPTLTPTGGQVRVRVEWTASTPLDLHQNDGGLLVEHPQVLGDGTAGTVVEVGSKVQRLRVGDRVFGFTWRSRAEKSQQEFVTVEEWLLAKLPEGFTLAEAVTLPNNFVTVFHALTTDLGVELPWPRLDDHVPEGAGSPVLIWGGSSSVGQFAIQILRYYGYTNVLATASRKQHDKLRRLGAKALFDYNDSDVVSALLREGRIPLILDCIGSKYGSLTPISHVAKSGAKVAILLPVIIRDSSETEAPEYEMDVLKAADWERGGDARGVRTHFYHENEFFKYHLQPDIMPTMLKERIVEPQRQKSVDGATLLERAQNAMDMLRRKETSMERLVWRVSDTNTDA